MTKPRLVKVWALFYVLQHIKYKRGCAYFDTASFKAMTDIAPGCPTEIRNRRGKIHQSVEDAALGFNFILYFCSVIVRRCDSQTILVSGLNFFITN